MENNYYWLPTCHINVWLQWKLFTEKVSEPYRNYLIWNIVLLLIRDEMKPQEYKLQFSKHFHRNYMYKVVKISATNICFVSFRLQHNCCCIIVIFCVCRLSNQKPNIAILGFWLDSTCTHMYTHVHTKECELIKSGHTLGLLAVIIIIALLDCSLFWLVLSSCLWYM